MATFPDERGQGTTRALSIRFDVPAPNGLQRVPPRHAAETAGARLLEAHLRTRCWSGARIREITRSRPNPRPSCPHPCCRIYFAPVSEISHVGGARSTGSDHADLAQTAKVHRPRNAAAAGERAISGSLTPLANLVNADRRPAQKLTYGAAGLLFIRTRTNAPRVERPFDRPNFLPVRTFPLRLWGPRTARKPVSQSSHAPFLAGRVGAHRHYGFPKQKQRRALQPTSDAKRSNRLDLTVSS